MRKRLTLLLVTLSVAVIAVACGRASQSDIDSALGITPSATLSIAQIATGTSQAASAAQTRTVALAEISSPGANGGSPVSFAMVGDVVQGKTQFQIRCARCHNPGGTGVAAAFVGSTNPTTNMTDDQILTLVRTGTGPRNTAGSALANYDLRSPTDQHHRLHPRPIEVVSGRTI